MELQQMSKKSVQNIKVRKIIYFSFGFLEVLFAGRLLLKLLGANPASIFASAIYSITHLFLIPFSGIFRTAVTEGIETKSVLEPSLLIAMGVYALLAYGIVRLIEIISNRRHIDVVE